MRILDKLPDRSFDLISSRNSFQFHETLSIGFAGADIGLIFQSRLTFIAEVFVPKEVRHRTIEVISSGILLSVAMIHFIVSNRRPF